MGINWRKMLGKTCERGEYALQFGDPERWVASEIYSVLAAQWSTTDQMQFPAEIPYGTNCPVSPGDKSKIADLCIEGESSYTWFELKVHHSTWNEIKMSSENMRAS